MKKIIFVKEMYVNDKLKEIVVRYKDEFGKATAIYNPVYLPKFVCKFMEKRNKELFSSEYTKEKFGLVEYIYRKEV